MSKMDKLKEILRELIKKREEASTQLTYLVIRHLTHLVVVERKTKRKRRR